MPLNVTALTVFVLFFALVTFVGFASVHWRKGDMDLLHEWGLAGGKFGTLITWFLLGGDIYTAYTFIAVPKELTAIDDRFCDVAPNAISFFVDLEHWGVKPDCAH